MELAKMLNYETLWEYLIFCSPALLVATLLFVLALYVQSWRSSRALKLTSRMQMVLVEYLTVTDQLKHALSQDIQKLLLKSAKSGKFPKSQMYIKEAAIRYIQASIERQGETVEEPAVVAEDSAFVEELLEEPAAVAEPVAAVEEPKKGDAVSLRSCLQTTIVGSDGEKEVISDPNFSGAFAG